MDGFAILVERGHRRRVAQVDSPDLCPTPVTAALPLAGGVPLVVDVSVSEQEFRRALLGVYGVIVGI